MTVRVVGFAELKADFNTLEQPDRVESAIVDAITPIATKLRDRAAGYSRNLPTRAAQSRSTGKIATGLRVFKTKRKIGVRSGARHAGVQEFGRHYARREHPRRSKKGGTATVRAHEVTMHSPPSRILYKAAGELEPEIDRGVEQAMDQVWRNLGFEVH